MKRAIMIIFLSPLLIIGCGKKNDPTPLPTTAMKYMTTTAGSTWNYETSDLISGSSGFYLLTSTNRDSTALTRTYHVYTNSGTRGSEYYNISGNDYYSYQNLPAAFGGTKVENLYLKDNVAVNASWTQTFPIAISGISINVTLTNKMAERAITKTVNGITYSDVIHIITSLAATGVPAASLTSDIQSYYAPKVGLIENTTKINLNFLIVSNTNTHIALKSSTIL